YRCRDSIAVIGHDHQDGQLIARPRGPDHATGEIALRGAGVAADDDGDAVAALPLLYERGAGGHYVLHFDDAGDRQDVPLRDGVVADEVAAHRVPVGGRHRHLADVVYHRHAHREQHAGVAIVQVQIIEGRSTALLHL